MNTPGDRLRFLRGNMSQAEFGVKLGIEQRKLSRLETGKTGFDLEVTQNICKELKVSSDWLLFGQGPMRRDGVQEDTTPSGAESEKDSRIRELERQLAEAKDETIRAYRLVAQHMAPQTKEIQEEPNFTNGGEGVGQSLNNSRNHPNTSPKNQSKT